MRIPLRIDKNVYRRLNRYVKYICAPTDPKYWVLYKTAVAKWNYIIDSIIMKLGEDINGGRVCPYPKFSNNGAYRIEQIQDRKTRTTVWNIAFADQDACRIIYAIELDKVLAAINESTIGVPLTDSKLRSIINEAISEFLMEAEDKAVNDGKKRGPNGYSIEKNGCDYIYRGKKRHSVISVVNRYGNQKYHIDTDDHCYVFYAEMDGKTEDYPHPYIFDELLDAIKMLPQPS